MSNLNRPQSNPAVQGSPAGTIRKFIGMLTGGRPMKVRRHLFVDRVADEDVYEFEDTFGRLWMANGPWSTFRVRLHRTACNDLH